ncbi:Metallo-dependent phosphatase [Mycena venus]|uniref:Metallo-dependent phosphatase n=1 Tax=Mycena venus TaxID=2733690 RepID=A0A8H6XGJ0_9AGAR|nr:Metallo-dependent phosphatase [Mycena venus]
MFRPIRTVLFTLWAVETAFSVPLQYPLTPVPLRLLDPYPDKPRLTFRPDGMFKLTIFSDLHFGENPNDGVGVVKDANSTRLMRAILQDERPDYVVFNGDLITGDYTFRENSTLLIDQIMAPLLEAQVLFSSTHGNHDNHVNITHLEEIAREQKIAPNLSYTRTAPTGVGGVGGPGNYWVPIYTNANDAAPALVLWFFDSRGGVSPSGTPLPDWVDASVAPWITRETALMDTAWGTTPRGALAFVHIAPHAIQAVQPPSNSSIDLGLNDDPLGGGSVQDSNNIVEEETFTDSQITQDYLRNARDAPFFAALGTIPNLYAVISGHAHGNEWCARTRGVQFCFNKHSGYGGYDKPGWGHGVRNVLFNFSSSPSSEDNVDVDNLRSESEVSVKSTRVETWIRLEEGKTRARANLVLNGNRNGV